MGKYGEPWGNGGVPGHWVMYDDDAKHIFSNLEPSKRQWEQMRRARLAVNATAGLSDTALESGVIGQARNALSMAETVWSTALAHRHGGEPKEQREPVLNAIRAALALLATEGE